MIFFFLSFMTDEVFPLEFIYIVNYLVAFFLM